MGEAAMQLAGSPVDTGWAWVVCLAGSFVHVLIVGCVRSTGILLANVSEYYGRSKGDTSWIMGLMFLTFLSFSPVTMTLAKRYSVRLITLLGSLCLCISFSVSYFATSLEFLYVTIGLFVGLGLSMMHPPTLLLVNMYFNKYRTVATGITMAGCSVGALCMPPFINWLIEEFTFRGSMLILGGVMLHTSAASLLFRPFRASPPATETPGNCDAEEDCERFCKSADDMHDDCPVADGGGRGLRRSSSACAACKSKEDLAARATMMASCSDIMVLSHPAPRPQHSAESLGLNLQLLRRPRFWVIAVALAIGTEGLPLNFLILPQHGKQLGLLPAQFTQLLQYQGVSDFVARIGIGIVADRRLMRRQTLLWLLTVLQAGLWALLLATPSYLGLLAFALGEGAFGGGLVSVLMPCLIDAFGIDSLATSYGCMGILEGGVMLLVPTLLGKLFDETGSWNASITVVGGSVGFAGLLLLVDDVVARRRSASAEKRTAEVTEKFEMLKDSILAEK